MKSKNKILAEIIWEELEEKWFKKEILKECPKCGVCGALIDEFWFKEYSEASKSIEHHISYKPEKTIFVCPSCHGKIHNTDQYPSLKPRDKREPRERKTKLVLCIYCGGRKVRVPIDYPNDTGICSRCKKDKSIERRALENMKAMGVRKVW